MKIHTLVCARLGRALCFVFIVLSALSLGCDDEPTSSAGGGASAGEPVDAQSGIEQMGGAAGEGCPPAGGVASAGEPLAGEPLAGEPVAGEPVAGEPVAGEPVAGELVAGEPVAGEPVAGEPMAGEPVAGEPMAGESIEGGSQGGSTPPEPPEEASARYDGVYVAAFTSGGEKVALARARVGGGLIYGELINAFGERFELAGFVDQSGVLRVPTLIGDMGSQVSTSGRIDQYGRIEGTYVIGEREGTFAGSLENQALSAPSPAYDGLYDLSFIRGGEEVAVTTLSVRNGRFTIKVVNREGQRFEADGFVAEDGTMTLSNGRGGDFSVIAEGHIDVEEGLLEGLYSVGPLVGAVRGRPAD